MQQKIFDRFQANSKEEIEYIQNMDPEVLDSTALDQQLIEAKQRESLLLHKMLEKEGDLSVALEKCAELKVNNPDLVKNLELAQKNATRHEWRAE